MSTQLMKFRCKIQRGAFSGERIVTFSLGSVPHKIVAPVHYCTTSTGAPMSELVPPPGQTIDGFVQLIVTEVSGSAVLAMPDGEMLNVAPSELEKLTA